jgi:hypothetical protein
MHALLQLIARVRFTKSSAAASILTRKVLPSVRGVQQL